MSTRSGICGHSEQRRSLSMLLGNNTLAHSNLFAGPAGIGKSLVATELGKALLCENKQEGKACMSCDSCKLVDSGNHPDFHFRECKNSEFNAEMARELLYSINLAPYRSNKRVIILNDADSLSGIVANLLLKTLEEPRKDTFFFLTASNPSRLPIPVISRCQVWRFSRLTDQEVRNCLETQANPAQINDLVQLAAGSLEHLKDLESFLSAWQDIREKLEKIYSGDSSLALSLATEMSRDKSSISAQLSYVRLFAQNRMKGENKPDKKLILADSLENAITAERLICERNIAPLSVLNLMLLGLSGRLPAQGRLIGEITV